MTPPAKRARFHGSPVRRSSRTHRRPDRYGVFESPRRPNSRTTSRSSPLNEVAPSLISTDVRSVDDLGECSATDEEMTKNEQCGLLDLPPDVLRMLFNMFTFQVLRVGPPHSQTLGTGSATFLAQQVSQSLRLVCRHLHQEAGRFLNSALLALGSRLSRSLGALEMQLTSAQDEIEWRAASRAYGALETVYSQYRLVEAVIWRWLSPRHTWNIAGRDVGAASAAATSAGCCSAGCLLDDLYQLALTAVTAPDNLAVAALSRRSKIDSAVTRLINYFEKTAGGAAWRRSAQVVDLLDCLLAARYTPTREATEEEAAAGFCKLRGRYHLPRAWFTSLPLGGSSPDETTPNDARLMALRLRRLVRSSNEHHLDSIQREREAAALPSFGSPAIAAYLSSPASTYSGFGESSNRFFYYGSMNERAAKTRQDTESTTQQTNNRGAAAHDDDPDYEPLRLVNPRNDPEADNHSQASGEDLAPVEGAEDGAEAGAEARSEFDENELALLEEDAARDIDDILAEIPPPDMYNDLDDQLPQEDGFPPDVDDYRWMDEVLPYQFEDPQPYDVNFAASVDDNIIAEVESTGVPSAIESSLTCNTKEKENQSEYQAESEEIVEGSDLVFDVDLTCPIELAPLAVCRKFEFATLEYEASKLSSKHSKSRQCKMKATATPSTSTNKTENVELVEEESEVDEAYGFSVPFHLVLTIRCPTAARNRLPAIYVYQAKSPMS